MPPTGGRLASTEANNQEKSFLGKSDCRNTGEKDSGAAWRQATGLLYFLSPASPMTLFSFLPKTSITPPPQRTSPLRGVWGRISSPFYFLTRHLFLQVLRGSRVILESVSQTAQPVRKIKQQMCEKDGAGAGAGTGWRQVDPWSQDSHSQFRLPQSSPSKITYAIHRNKSRGRKKHFTNFQIVLYDWTMLPPLVFFFVNPKLVLGPAQ